MISRKSPVRNQRRSTRGRGQSLLEVSVRPRLASQQRNRRLFAWSSKLILCVAVVWGLFYGGREGLRRFLWENPEYNLAVVEINNDGQGVTREMILGATGLELGRNLFSVSLADARKALLEMPQVDHVELRRLLPNKITIDLVERRPVAWLARSEAEDPSMAEDTFLIDDKGVLFKPKRLLTEYLRLPVISGVETANFLPGETVDLYEVQSALDLVRQSSDAGVFQIQGINLSKGYCMVVNDIRNKKIFFPLEKIEDNLQRLVAVFDYATANQKDIATVNLLVERNIPITEVSTASVASGDAEKAANEGMKEKGMAPANEAAKVMPAASKPSATKVSRNTSSSKSNRSVKTDSRNRSGSKAPTPKRVERDVLRALPPP